MGREHNWKCNKLRTDVELRSIDYRLCEPCFPEKKNEAELAVLRAKGSGGTQRSGHVAANEHVTSMSRSRLVKRGDGGTAAGMSPANGPQNASTATAGINGT